MGTLSDCYALRNFEWVKASSMLSPRYKAAAVKWNASFVMVGGGFFRGSSMTDSTELFNGDMWIQGLLLPGFSKALFF